MKKMNYLFSAVCVLIFSACTNESQSIEEDLLSTELRGRETQEQTYYLELDLHQSYLTWEEKQIQKKIIQLKEYIEKYGEGHEKLEQQQKKLELNQLNFKYNEELSLGIRPIAPRPLPRPCGSEEPFLNCPIELGNIHDDIFVSTKQLDNLKIQVLNKEGEVVGEMVGLEGIKVLVRAIIDFDESAATQILVTKTSVYGELTKYSFPIGY